jgi:hypothetical protein
MTVRPVRAASTLKFPKMFKFAKSFLEEAFPDGVNDITDNKLKYAAEAVVLGRDWIYP